MKKTSLSTKRGLWLPLSFSFQPGENYGVITKPIMKQSLEGAEKEREVEKINQSDDAGDRGKVEEIDVEGVSGM